jgi:hypothetical protein
VVQQSLLQNQQFFFEVAPEIDDDRRKPLASARRQCQAPSSDSNEVTAGQRSE